MELTQEHRSVIIEIRDFIEKGEFYLAGGTAVFYYLKHRESLDLDFFTEKEFDFRDFQHIFRRYEIYSFSKDTIYCDILGTKVSFFYYPYPLIRSLKNLEFIKIASLEDILCMKIAAIIQRGIKKDFIDLYFIMNELKLSASETISIFQIKYGKFNPLIIHKALTYFDDAEKEPDLRMIKPVLWQKIKEYLIENFSKNF